METATDLTPEGDTCQTHGTGQETATDLTPEEDTCQTHGTGPIPEAGTKSQDPEIGNKGDQLREAETTGRRKYSLKKHEDATDAIGQVTCDDHAEQKWTKR